MKKIVSIIFAAFVAAPLFAQTYSAMLQGSDPESFSLGAATLARPANARSAGDNAAAMAISGRKMAVGASYSMWSPKVVGSKIAGIGGWGKIGDKFAIGLDAKYAMGKPYDITDELGWSEKQFAPKDINANLGVSYAIIDGLSVGVSAKFVSSTLADKYSATAFGADVSVAFRKGGLGAAIAVCNLGSSLRYGSSKETVALPSMAKAGVSYSIVGLTASAEVDYMFKGGLMAGLGLEYAIKDIAFIRAGYHYGDAEKAMPSFASVGLGVKFFGVELNAAYLLASPVLGNTMMFGAGYSF